VTDSTPSNLSEGSRLRHRPAGSVPSTDVEEDDVSADRTLASAVEIADSTLSKARGLMFRRSIPDDYALVFPFEDVDARTLHMLFVPFPIDAVWIADGTVMRTKRLRPFVGIGRARADTVIELPAGAADAVEPGDAIAFPETR
jgi:uncharacterized membrane protein (UPF0127 family)